MHHFTLNWAGPHDRYLNHEVVIAARFKSWQHTHLRARFDLKDANRVGSTHHVVNRGVLGWNPLNRQRLIAVFAHQVEAFTHCAKHTEREHIDF